MIDLPGPFYLLALGDMATGGYSTAEQLGLIMLFNAIMFLLFEVPLIRYLVRPETTAERVASFATWLNANGLRVIGWLVGAVGVGLIAQGLAAAAAERAARRCIALPHRKRRSSPAPCAPASDCPQGHFQHSVLGDQLAGRVRDLLPPSVAHLRAAEDLPALRGQQGARGSGAGRDLRAGRRVALSARCRAVGSTPEMPVAESEQGSRPIRSRVQEQRSALPDRPTPVALARPPLCAESGYVLQDITAPMFCVWLCAVDEVRRGFPLLSGI